MQTLKSCKIRDRDCKQTLHRSDKQIRQRKIKCESVERYASSDHMVSKYQKQKQQFFYKI